MHANKKVIPYVEPKEDKPAEFGSTISSTLPMAAVSQDGINTAAELMVKDVHEKPHDWLGGTGDRPP